MGSKGIYDRIRKEDAPQADEEGRTAVRQGGDCQPTCKKARNHEMLGDKMTEPSASSSWSYQEAFCRNLGLISKTEQEQLCNSHVAVTGLGGVGGIDLVTLARLGIGHFTIADPDVFEVRNFNRQYGATCSTVGLSKAHVMDKIVRDINPEAKVRVFDTWIGPENADSFLEGANVLVDGIDAFEIDLRRLLFRKARDRGIFALGAGPVGFSTPWVIFSPTGMTFDRYFDLKDEMDSIEKFVAFIIGMTPASTHRSYIDLSYLDFANHRGPSAGLACQLAAGVLACEVLKILLNRGHVYSAPFYHQFDAYLGRLVRKRLIAGNRHPLQRFKRRWLENYIRKHPSARAEASKTVRMSR
jgi:molybdopterin/thiamine biosynthesis adenylyltransferase